MYFQCRQWLAGIPGLPVAREMPERNAQNCQDKVKLKFPQILKSFKVRNTEGMGDHTDNSTELKQWQEGIRES